jgi:hypothetical protein
MSEADSRRGCNSVERPARRTGQHTSRPAPSQTQAPRTGPGGGILRSVGAQGIRGRCPVGQAASWPNPLASHRPRPRSAPQLAGRPRTRPPHRRGRAAPLRRDERQAGRVHHEERQAGSLPHGRTTARGQRSPRKIVGDSPVRPPTEGCIPRGPTAAALNLPAGLVSSVKFAPAPARSPRPHARVAVRAGGVVPRTSPLPCPDATTSDAS